MKILPTWLSSPQTMLDRIFAVKTWFYPLAANR